MSVWVVAVKKLPAKRNGMNGSLSLTSIELTLSVPFRCFCFIMVVSCSVNLVFFLKKSFSEFL